jgi:hypothetical protein
MKSTEMNGRIEANTNKGGTVDEREREKWRAGP